MDAIEFAQKIKAKIPDYEDMDDLDLARKMVNKYPEDYSDVVFPDSTAQDTLTQEPIPQDTVQQEEFASPYSVLLPATKAYHESNPQVPQEVARADMMEHYDTPVASAWARGLGRPEAAANTPLAQTFDDVTGFLTKLTEGGRRMFTGQGVEGLISALQDPKAGIFQGSREETASFWNEQANNAPNAVMKKVYQTMGVLGSGGYGLAEDPIGTVASGGSSLLGKTGKKIPIAGVAKKDLLSPEGVPWTPAQAKGQNVSMVESYSQANPFTQKIPMEIQQKQMEVIQETIGNVSKSLKGNTPKNIEGSVRGDIIQQRVLDAKNVTQKQFAEGNQKIMEAVGQKPVNFSEVDLMGPSKSGLVDAKGKPIIGVIGKVWKSNAMDNVKRLLSDAKHELGQPITNTRPVSAKAIERMEGFYNELADAKNIEELLNNKRNITGDIFDDVQRGLFSNEKDILWLRSINGELNNAIEASIRTVSPGVPGETLANTFRSINKMYEDNLDALMHPSKVIGVGKDGFRPEDVLGKIKLIGSANLNKMKKASKSKPEIKAVYNEMQTAAYESLIFNSMDFKSMQIIPGKFVTNWNKMDKGLKTSIFPDKVILENDKIVANYNKSRMGDLKEINPSGTGKMNFLTAIWKKPVDATTAALMYFPVKTYYSKGSLPHQTIWNMVRGSDGKLGLTAKKRAAIIKAQSMGNFLRSSLNLKEKEK